MSSASIQYFYQRYQQFCKNERLQSCLSFFTCAFSVSTVLFLFLFLKRSLSLSPRQECTGVISAHCHLRFLDSHDSPALASQGAGITVIFHHAQLIFVFLVQMWFHHVGQASLKHLTYWEHFLKLLSKIHHPLQFQHSFIYSFIFLHNIPSHNISLLYIVPFICLAPWLQCFKR